jgi:hypothetical protein
MSFRRSKAVTLATAAAVATCVLASTGCAQGSKAEAAASAAPLESGSIAMNYPTYESLSDLANRADAIVVGEVTRVSTELVEMAPEPLRNGLPEHKRASTRVAMSEYEITPVRKARGMVGEKIKVIQPGGSAGGQSVDNEDEEELAPGNRYLLFLIREPDGRFAIVGGAQGTYRVVAGDKLSTYEPNERDVRGKLHGRPLAAVLEAPELKVKGNGRQPVPGSDQQVPEPAQQAPAEKHNAPIPAD